MNKLKYIGLLVIILVVASCGNDKAPEQEAARPNDSIPEIQNKIKALEAEMHSSMEINNATAANAIKLYHDYAKMYPEDSITPDYLFKAAEIATAVQQYPQALNDYETITEKYPSYKLMQESLFLQASLLDHYLNDDIKAEGVYEELIKKYPTGIYAVDAKAAIQNLGKTDAELHEEFKRKNGEK
ncbi:MAG TPA: tetratricopeptide repeat protein [Bacteroidia bacterium]|jgi:TolA-binding protein